MNDNTIKIVIFGAGQTAEIVYHYFANDSSFSVVAFTVNAEHRDKKSLFGLPIVEFEEIEKKYPPDEFKMFVAMTYSNLNKLRAEKYKEAKQKDYTLVSYISSKAGIVGKLDIGDNCLVLENQLIQPYAKIGNNVFVWSGVLIGHNCKIGDHCWLTSDASIGGNTNIGSYSFLGLNCTIGHMINIGSNCLIGAGAQVTKDAVDNSVFISKDTDLFALDSERFMKISKLK